MTTTGSGKPTDESQFRHEPPRVASERIMYQAWLDYHRGTLLWKCAGLTDDQLKTASAPPSSLTLLGLLRHMSEVERWWFRSRAAGLSLPDLYCRDDDEDGDFDGVAQAVVAQNIDTFRAECLAADEAVQAKALDDTFTHRDDQVSLRWVYLHMIEEYARHNGHADLLRERIDGTTGE